MNTRILTIGIVAVFLMAGLGYVLLGAGGDDSGMNGMTAQVSIYNPDSGAGWQADASLDKPSTLEMMSMGLTGIRKAEFEPMEAAQVSGIGISTHYHVWVKLTAETKTSTEVFSSVKSSKVTIQGQPAHWDGPHAMGDLVSEGGLDKIVSPSSWKLPLNGKTVIQQGGVTETGTTLNLGYHFDQFKDPAGVANQNGVKTLPIRGENLDGMKIRVTIDAVFVKTDGTLVTKSTSAELNIDVTSWADGGVNLTITDMGFNDHPQAGMIAPMAMVRF